MASKYQKLYTIPTDFPALLKSLTREVLRAQPSNIYEFGARYFSELIEQRNGEEKPDGGAVENLTALQFEELAMRLFLEADEDRSGCLDRCEFAAVLKNNQLKLEPWQIRKLHAEVDENNDGVINYREFVPIMLDVFEATAAAQQAGSRDDEPSKHLLNELTKDEFEQQLEKVLRRADKSNSGTLTRQELKECLAATELGLVRTDVNLLLGELSCGKEAIKYEEYIPKCFEILNARHSDALMCNELTTAKDTLCADLIDCFTEKDKDSSGMLPLQDVKDILKKKSFMSLGLTTFQIATLLTHAPITSDDKVEYVKVAEQVAEMVHSLRDPQSRRRRHEAIVKISGTDGAKTMSFASPETVKVVLERTFQEVDTEGTGRLSMEQLKDVLDKLASGGGDDFQIPRRYLDTIFMAMDADKNGMVDYKELADFWTDVLNHVSRETLIEELVGTAA